MAMAPYGSSPRRRNLRQPDRRERRLDQLRTRRNRQRAAAEARRQAIWDTYEENIREYAAPLVPPGG
jgi:hypothetical protein